MSWGSTGHKVRSLAFEYDIYPLVNQINNVPVVPHKAVAEVSKIGNL
jgi:hypothetical protein